jgi:hypothetical protein
MHTPTFPSLQSRYKSFISRGSNQTSSNGFFQTYAISEIVRGLFFSSVLWLLLAIALYGIYTMVAGTV